eukprot:gnl/TRDRNA2_/TRDRNA2_44914_c0_seq2.p1 gnl/TRDRNA2_/TRDRNA2_44914_c0~~gnl/TRDRNA2_/TRDRNA2_44914_c0_seq2.p1  ORF type:complete len:554 (+),score=88.00 gnl/TRDRNA2_/TRDRNA2_44914_c0_seq2:113-1774(+)
MPPRIEVDDSDEDLVDEAERSLLNATQRDSSWSLGSTAAEVPQRKWWHVPDEKIQDLVCDLASPTNDASSSMGRSARQSRMNSMSRTCGSISTGSIGCGGLFGRFTLHEGSPTHRDGSKSNPPDVPTPLAEVVMRRYSKIASGEHPAKEATVQVEAAAAPAGGDVADPAGTPQRGWWKVDDYTIEQMVESTIEEHGGSLLAAAKSSSPHSPLARGGAAMVGRADGTGSLLERSFLSGSVASSSRAPAPRSRSLNDNAEAEKLLVYIYFVDSGDTMSLKVHPDMKLGPPKPPPRNCFTDMFGQGASTKGFSEQARQYDYRHRKFAATQRPGWTKSWESSFKGMIERISGIESSRLRLKHRGSPLSMDHFTLRSYGITHDSEITVFIQPDRLGQDPVLAVTTAHERRAEKSQSMRTSFTGGPASASPKHRDVTLASTIKYQRRQHEGVSGGHGQTSQYSLRHSPYLKECKSDGDLWIMPKWVSQENPRIFADVGIGLDGLGSASVAPEFALEAPWLQDVNDSNMSTVREAMAQRHPDGSTLPDQSFFGRSVSKRR